MPPPQDSEQYGRRGSGVSGPSMGNISTSRSHSSRRDSDLQRTQASRTDHSRGGSQSTLTQRDRVRTASGGDSGDIRSDQQMGRKRRPSELTSIRSRRSEGCNNEGGHRSTQRSVGSRMEAKGANVPIDVMRTEPQGRRLGLLYSRTHPLSFFGKDKLFISACLFRYKCSGGCGRGSRRAARFGGCSAGGLGQRRRCVPESMYCPLFPAC